MESIETFVADCFGRIKNFLQKIVGFFYYQHEQRKNFYPCKLTSEFRYDAKGHTIIRYKTFGKKHEYEIKITKLFEDKHLLEKFHPIEASKITLIAFGELFFIDSGANNKTKFKQIRNKTLTSIKK